jgi:phytanoyl-CoA hydroxylase
MKTTFPSCPTGLSASQISEYHENGYLAFTDVLSPEELQGAREGLSALIERLRISAKADFKRTKVQNTTGAYLKCPSSNFFLQLESQTDPASDTPEEFELKVRKLMHYHDQHPLIDYISKRHPKIRGILDAILGANAILFQDMALVKPPFIGSEKPWHQDDAYFSVTPLDSIMGIWIALDSAEVENGCMHVLPGKHRTPLKHYHGIDCQILETELDASAATPVELPAGGAMFFHGLLPHETPPNRSPLRRRALQFHFRSADSKIISKEDYHAIFVDAKGRPASCDVAVAR